MRNTHDSVTEVTLFTHALNFEVTLSLCLLEIAYSGIPLRLHVEKEVSYSLFRRGTHGVPKGKLGGNISLHTNTTKPSFAAL